MLDFKNNFTYVQKQKQIQKGEKKEKEKEKKKKRNFFNLSQLHFFQIYGLQQFRIKEIINHTFF
jgi:hypothetical protein